MIIEIENGKIKKIEVVGENRSPKKGEILVPSDWGTEDFLRFINGNKNNNTKFFIGEDPDDVFSLFDVNSEFYYEVYSNSINPSFPNNEFSLFEV